MAYYSKKRPAELLKATARYERGAFRIEHRQERKIDQLEAVSQKRRDNGAARGKVRAHQERVRI